jgi:hypothetical protein
VNVSFRLILLMYIYCQLKEEHANYIKEKLQELFDKKFPLLKLESKYTELWLKNTWIYEYTLLYRWF